MPVFMNILHPWRAVNAVHVRPLASSGQAINSIGASKLPSSLSLSLSLSQPPTLSLSANSLSTELLVSVTQLQLNKDAVDISELACQQSICRSDLRIIRSSWDHTGLYTCAVGHNTASVRLHINGKSYRRSQFPSEKIA